ncbi:MAG: hypothetical protein ACTFAL_04530 [Candidatus Electronema sp. V4]|uniref:hypothetical protein n=1 Tax=Candidatus Electronema sp. V4 TaxID=3454756 RepID=UPI00405596FB
MARSILLLAAVLFCFALFTLPFGLPQRMALVDRKITPQAAGMVGDKYYDDLVCKLNHRKPELILIGNSMLGEGVDERHLESLLHTPAAAVWNGGVGSAWWYLAVKNIIPQLKKKPALIGIVFRDNHLTLPTMRVTGKHKPLLDSLAGEDEELLDRLAYLSQENLLSLQLKKYIPLFNKREYCKQSLDSALKGIASSLLRLPDPEAVDQAAASVFASGRMIPALLNQRQLDDERKQDSAKEDMSFQPEKNFLKPMIELCREQDVQLIFIRVKRRRDLEPGRQPPELLAYMDKLAKYLQANKVHLLDYTGHAAIQTEHFGEGDHLNRQSGRQLFTALLAADLQKMMPITTRDN